MANPRRLQPDDVDTINPEATEPHDKWSQRLGSAVHINFFRRTFPRYCIFLRYVTGCRTVCPIQLLTLPILPHTLPSRRLHLNASS